MSVAHFIRLGLLLVSCADLALSAQCPTGWLHFQESCYKIERNPLKTWPDAKQSCVNQQAHLAIVMTLEENSFLRNETMKIGEAGRQYWMDGTDMATEGTWIWDKTGELFEVNDWAPNEPNQNGGQEDCLSIFSTLGYHWNDEHCNSPQAYICEKGDSSSGTGVVG
ncbi:perlucin-like [Mya arenaria]|uniref:perlucin-like n=1 Tax=Mya arenaria TaxID=6604 RepID=UPI0022DED80D|nr:perlucin-like [Mya arenaria]